MALAEDMQCFCEKMVKDSEERKKCMTELREYVGDYLDHIKTKREESSLEMWCILREDRENRMGRVSELLEEYTEDRRKARKNWAKCLKAIDKIRLSY